MQKIFINIISIVLFTIFLNFNIYAGEVELFITSDRAEKILLEEKKAKKLEYENKYNSFKKNINLSAIHENSLAAKNNEIISDGGAVIIEDEEDVSLSKINNNVNSTLISDTNYIHENIPEKNIELASKNNFSNMLVHENFIEFDNFIVHENTINHKYSNELLASKAPDKNKIWDSAASQATLLFSTSAKDRDQATEELIKNGNWFKTAEKLLKSKDEKIRLNGINIIKVAVNSPKYKNIPLSKKINKLSPCLLSSLKDSNTKVRFIASLILSKLTGTNFNYKFDSNPTQRNQAIIVWNQHIKTNYGL